MTDQLDARPSAPVASTITKRGRYYVDQATGKKYPSVTTVIDLLEKPALRMWYAKQVAERAVSEIAEVSRRIRLDGEIDAAAWLAEAPRQAAREAAVKGSDLHDLADRHGKGEPLPEDLTNDARMMLAHYETFLADWEPVILRTEMTVLNREFGYGGTCDAVMRLKGELVPLVVDYKTGRTGPYPEWALQLAAYSRGQVALTRHQGAILEEPVPDVDRERALILRVRPDRYELYEVDLTGLFYVFAQLLIVHRWVQDTGDVFMRRNVQHDWLTLVRTAETVEQLYDIYGDAVVAGETSERLLIECKTRKAQLTGKEL